MKVFDLRAIAAILMLLAIATGCKKDPCEGVNCLHGVCNDGSCVCESGWTGEFCTQEIASSDPCDNVTCENGTCDNGTCICDQGWTGSSCNVPVSNSLAGNYVLSENCSNSGQASPYVVGVLGGATVTTITFSGLWEEVNSNTTATLDTDLRTITIARQDFGSGGWEIDGSGTYSADYSTITLDYSIYDEATGTLIDQCPATMQK